MSKDPVIIVGAGIGGLVAALELANRGLEVVLLERAERPGGKMREVPIGPHRIDSGPTVFTLRRVFDETFERAGTALDDHVTLRPIDRLARHAWNDEAHLDLFADRQQSFDAIAAFAGTGEARGYQRFCRDAERTFNALDTSFIRAAKPSIPGLITSAGVRGLPALMRLRPFSSLWRVLGEYFRDERLRQLFGRYATYCGASPFEASATLMLVAHVENAGVWQVEGGMYRLAEALARVACDRGVQLRCNNEVREVEITRGRATGVVLADGERIAASAVVMNADAGALGSGRFGPAAATATRTPVERSLSAVTFSLVAKTRDFPLVHHNVFFSRDYKAEFTDIFERRQLPGEPTIYVCAQDRGGNGEGPGPDQAERMLFIANAPADGDTRSFSADELANFETRVLEVLARCGLTLECEPDARVITSPAEFEGLFPGTGGAIYGEASHGWRSAFVRASPRSRVPGLYLCGGSVHPGPGVPMAAQSGQTAAACLLADRGAA